MADEPVPNKFVGSGGTEGGLVLYGIGLVLCVLSVWLFLDSVQLTTAGPGWVSGLWGGVPTGSAGIVFVPFFLGVVALFYDARQEWAWWLMFLGIGIIVLEIISRVHFLMTMKTSHFLLMTALFAAGTGLMLRSYKPLPRK